MMQVFKGKATITQLQWLVWISVYIILFLSFSSMDGFKEGAFYTNIYIVYYVIIIYGNIRFLYPRFYETRRYVLYGLLALVLLVLTGVGRGYVSTLVYNTYFAKAGQAEPLTLPALLKFVLSGGLIFALSFIFRIAIAYFKLKQQTEEILVQKSQAELNLLKSQVQPHFLFNTLNNIYYEAYREAPRTAALIERLSDIMRYFLDESPLDEVSINTEVKFLENYLELEKIRIRHEVQLTFVKQFNPDLRIPPMLLMTFVENIFKHGIDKSSLDNCIKISLVQEDNYLMFETVNRIYDKPKQNGSNGFGITNLRKRLTLLYQNNFELDTHKNEQSFTAFLKIPLA
ncbi:sensor histidine kinase [Mucilaginibacter sp. SG564]|uniref:sensor histidine kinase n=1 Tax=unclassified Mucilaginibacter TaxID=2617802 RepID=UPI001554538D|nr:histidine kinase [Mucilaginibacter sp. SG564]NOW98537.1 sensor histidine kinase YesM [Mucilaginibacter sp. SG564]